MSRRTFNQHDLDHAVANATGEDLRFIRRRGFSIIDLADENFDPEPNLLPPQYIDWDDLESFDSCGSAEEREVLRQVA